MKHAILILMNFTVKEDMATECHLFPVSKMSLNHKTKLDDLCLLCSNCHRIIHMNTPG